MRELIDRYWLAIAETLRIPPWELDQLTHRQLRQAVAYVDELKRKTDEADRGR